MMEKVSFDMLITAIVVILAVCGGIVTVSNAVKAIREFRKPNSQKTEMMASQIKDHSQMLSNDKRMLERHDAELTDLKRGQMSICQGVQALIEHELHNGNEDEMREASKNIGKWLRER